MENDDYNQSFKIKLLYLISIRTRDEFLRLFILMMAINERNRNVF
jgi:hypothetical protein